MPSQITTQAVIDDEKRIVRDAAGLSKQTVITLNDRGWDSRVYSFENDKYFFKFPRSDKIRRLYTYEIAAIKFAGQLDPAVCIQKILWEHPDNTYFGYAGVPGRPLAEVAANLDAATCRQIGKALGSFLRQFHKLTLEGARNKDIDEETSQLHRWYKMSLPEISRHFTKQERLTLDSLVQTEWPANLHGLGSDPVLSHGDLHFENILYAGNGQVGLIDFGDAAYYDRSKDFLELGSSPRLFGNMDSTVVYSGKKSPSGKRWFK